MVKAILWYMGWLSFFGGQDCRPVLRRMYPLRSLLKPGKQDDIFAVFSRFQRRTPGLLHRYILYSWAWPPIFPTKRAIPFIWDGFFWGLGGEEAKLTRSTWSASLTYCRACCESLWTHRLAGSASSARGLQLPLSSLTNNTLQAL
jgi:hypothetical protein